MLTHVRTHAYARLSCAYARAYRAYAQYARAYARTFARVYVKCSIFFPVRRTKIKGTVLSSFNTSGFLTPPLLPKHVFFVVADG